LPSPIKKSVVLFFITAINCTLIKGQNTNTGFENNKKAMKATQRKSKVRELSALVWNRRFVLEADYIVTRFGIRVPVSSFMNFIAVDFDKAYFQLRNAEVLDGPNGFGGTTLKGIVNKYVYKEKIRKKSTTIYVTLNISSAIWGSFEMNLIAYNNGKADAMLSFTNRVQTNYYGKLVSPSNSKIFKGVPAY